MQCIYLTVHTTITLTIIITTTNTSVGGDAINIVVFTDANQLIIMTSINANAYIHI